MTEPKVLSEDSELIKRLQQIQSSDMQDIQNATRILGISEFRLFELAYLEWYGQTASECDLERVYIPYLFAGEIPFWVRQYSRNICSLSQQAGLLNQRLAEPENIHSPRAGLNDCLTTNEWLLLMSLLSMLVVIL